MNSTSLSVLCRGLLSCPTAPFHEFAPRQYVCEWARRHSFHIQQTSDGNLLVTTGSSKARRTIVLAVHMDHPGFVSVTPPQKGVFEARFLGGVSRAYFKKGTPVVFYPEHGVPIKSRLEKILDWSAGLMVLRGSGDILPGTLGMWDVTVCGIDKGILRGRACDDLTGCAAAMAVMESVSNHSSSVKVMGVFTRAEEVGFIGAISLARRHQLPSQAEIISIENSKALPDAPLGNGPIIRVGDRSSVFSNEITSRLVTVAEEIRKKSPSFEYQRRLMHGGTCEATAYQAFGYNCGAVCVPLGNYHNMGARRIEPEYIHLNDLKGLVRLLTDYCISDTSPALRQRLLKLHGRYKGMLMTKSNTKRVKLKKTLRRKSD